MTSGPRRVWILCMAVPALGVAGAAHAEDVTVVKVKGQGIDKDGAVKDALRHAIEQGGKNEIASHSQVKDFALEQDVILARANGLVKDYKVLSENSNGGITTVEIEAKVSKSLLDATWGDVAIELKKLGRPKIMIVFTETIHDLFRNEDNRETVQLDSMLGTAMERKLRGLGFSLIDAAAMSAVDRKKAEVAALNDDTAALKALASSHGAAIIIKGTSRASGPQETTAAGIKLYMWETDVTIRGVWTETAEIIFSNTRVGDRGGSRVGGPPGARQVLEKSGKILADASVYDMLDAWTRGTAANGVGDIVIDVAGVKDIRQGIEIKKGLAGIPGVDDVTKDGVKDQVKFTITTAMGAEEFVEKLIELKFDGFELDIQDQKMKTIVCKVK